MTVVTMRVITSRSLLPLGARKIVWRAVLPFRARDIERGPRSLLLCAAVIHALLRARRISFVRDGGGRNQHDKGGRAYHRDTLHQNAADFPGIIMTPALATATVGFALTA